jgi:hypothetical protein
VLPQPSPHERRQDIGIAGTGQTVVNHAHRPGVAGLRGTLCQQRRLTGSGRCYNSGAARQEALKRSEDRRRGSMKRANTVGAAVALITVAGSPAAVSHPLDDLPPGHWMEVPDSRLDALDPEDDPDANPNWPAAAPWHGVEGLRGIMDDWSSGAYDTERDQLLIWGGGHSGYAGNEVYAFDVATMRWLRLTDPAVDVTVTGTTLYPDGTPRARETYNYLQYVPAMDRLVSFGGGNLYPCCNYTTETTVFDIDALTWDTTSYTPHPGFGSAFGAIAALDDATGHVWFVPYGQIRISEYNPFTDAWTVHAATETLHYRNGAIDPKRRKLVWFGGWGDTVSFDLTAPALPPVAQATSGNTEIENVSWPGVVYDPLRDVLVAWGSGPDVYTLDVDTWVWTRVAAAPDNTVVPTAPNVNGTNGRFRYVPSRDVFILVNNVDQNVFFYRMPGSNPDGDSDGLVDLEDNCRGVPNGPADPDDGGNVQLDSDRDGIGNQCDADIARPNDCVVNFLDFAAVRLAFFSTPGSARWNRDADFNGDRTIDFRDLSVVKERFFTDYRQDNPSGIPNDCATD